MARGDHIIAHLATAYELREACEQGDLDTVKILTEETTKIIISYGLIIASESGYLNIVKFLFDKGADVNSQEGTAIKTAAQNGHFYIVEFLIKNGANVGLDVALGQACRRGHLDIVKILLKNGVKYSKLILQIAVTGGYFDIVKFLVDNKIAVINDSSNEYGTSALDIACREGHLEIVKYLIANGAELERSYHALFVAVQYGYFDIVRELIEHGSDIHAVSDKPLRMACIWGHFDIAKYLLDKGADILANEDLLELAIDSLDIIKLVVERGCVIPDSNTLHDLINEALGNGKIEIADFIESLLPPILKNDHLCDEDKMNPEDEDPIQHIPYKYFSGKDNLIQLNKNCFEISSLYGWMKEHDTDPFRGEVPDGFFDNLKRRIKEKPNNYFDNLMNEIEQKREESEKIGGIKRSSRRCQRRQKKSTRKNKNKKRRSSRRRM